MTSDHAVTPDYITEFMKANFEYFSDAFVDCFDDPDDDMSATYLVDVRTFNENPCRYFKNCFCPNMKPQPDIAGQGVLIAFAITAFITLCLSIYCLLVGHTNERRQTFNPVDRYVRKRISEPLRHFMHRKGFSPDLQSLVAYDLVNTFSDLQLVTGLAVLVAGFSELATGTISIYHSLIITDLAWFCTNSHLLSLAVTRSMRDSVKKTHPHRYSREHTETAARLVRALRITLMAATFAFLQIAFFGTGYKDMYNIEPNCPMKCTLSEPKGGRALRLMVTNMVLMAYFYAVQIFLTWRSGRIFWMDHIRGSLIDKQGQTVNILNPEVVFKQWTENRVLKTLKSTVLVVWYCLASEAGVLFGLTIYFVFGVYSLIDDRVRGHKKMDQKVHNEEDEVVYSQLVPIFVMIIPFMGIFESYARHSKAVREYEANELESRTSEGS